MKVFCFGVGKAGSAIADALQADEQTRKAEYIVDAVACDTAAASFNHLSTIPPANQIQFLAEEFDESGNSDINQIAAHAEEHHRQLLRGTDNAPVSQADAFLICAGLGGSTGGGAAPVLAKHLNRVYQQPVYGVGVLPATQEGPQHAQRAVQALRRFVSTTDHVLICDNESWISDGQPTAEEYATVNTELARRLGVLFAAGETRDDAVGESVVDASEIINTLHGGGVGAIGYASRELPAQDDGGWFGLKRFFGGQSTADVDPIEAQSRITTQTREALLGHLTAPCAIQSASRGLVVVSGPPAWLNRDAIEQSRTWVQEQTESQAIRGGDFPRGEAEQVEVLILLGGISPADRLADLRAVANADGDSEQDESA
ncbi:tubulin/FtsZ family protein [Halobellus rufus]|uniref:tubulin/FtsZ family protein n=1 Tax=Halobellus rufus TaxID=1448860 RepID=UPI000679E43E|nr:tubulin/FtsZ family protein [Halobellus rufus]